jgi:hypothetical protein
MIKYRLAPYMIVLFFSSDDVDVYATTPAPSSRRQLFAEAWKPALGTWPNANWSVVLPLRTVAIYKNRPVSGGILAMLLRVASLGVDRMQSAASRSSVERN